MKCQKCNLELEAGAKFCGNCGTLVPVAASSVPTVIINPVIATPVAQTAAPLGVGGQATTVVAPAVPQLVIIPENVPVGGKKIIAALIVSILSFIGCLFIPLVGIVLSLIAIGLGAGGLKTVRRKMATAAIVISILALALAAWGIYYNVTHPAEVTRTVE